MLRQKINPLEILVTLVTFCRLRMIVFYIGSPFVTFDSVVPLKKKFPDFLDLFVSLRYARKLTPKRSLLLWLHFVGLG